MSELPLPGTVLAGKYLVEGLLGRGGMGVVLAARHQQLEQKVAIKLLLDEARSHPEVVERFSREARAAAKIQGEHVARVLDVGVLDDGAPYIVMEYLEGRDLSAELRMRPRLPTTEVVGWILEACEAIAQAHAAKIVHRDLKPGNLFLARQPDGRSIVKVLDFGISKSVDPNAPALTKTSSLVGTPYYMAPEQLRAAKSVDTRADIWALGVIMYELIAGAPPFDGTQMPEIVAAILTNDPRPLAAWREDVAPGLARVIAQSMATKPEDRFQSVAALAAALAPFAAADQEVRVQRIARILGVTNPLQMTLSPDTEAAPAHGSSGSSGASGAGAERASDASATDKTMLLADAQAATAQSAPEPPPGTSAMATTKSSSAAPSPMASGVPAEALAVRSIAGVAASSTAPKAEPRGPALLIGAAVVALAAGGGLFVAFGKGATTDTPPPSGIVVSPTALSNVAAASIEPTTSAPAEPAESAEPAASSVPASSAPSAATSTKTPPSRPIKPVASASAPRPSVPSPPAPPTSAATPSTNPLDMRIK